MTGAMIALNSRTRSRWMSKKRSTTSTVAPGIPRFRFRPASVRGWFSATQARQSEEPSSTLGRKTDQAQSKAGSVMTARSPWGEFWATPMEAASTREKTDRNRMSQGSVASEGKTRGLHHDHLAPLTPSPARLDWRFPWGCSSAGRALQSHCRGRQFDPDQLHQ